MQYTRKELMYMERSIMTEMLAWSRKSKHKPLLITGVRQCGKTYICKEFGRRYFEDTAYFYFEGNHGLQSIFDYDLDPHRILSELGGLIYKKPIVPGKTLVIFDEIQACPRAITSLKYFCELMPELHIICAGSLLGVSLQRDGISFPVGKVERLVMYPMSFAEFLLACGQEHLLSGADKYLPDKPLAEAYTEPLKKFLKYYYITGGMPEAVATWLETKNFDAVTQIQNNILHDYSADFAKYAPVNDVPKLQLIWQSVPQQLAKENNKFIYGAVKEGAGGGFGGCTGMAALSWSYTSSSAGQQSTAATCFLCPKYLFQGVFVRCWSVALSGQSITGNYSAGKPAVQQIQRSFD